MRQLSVVMLVVAMACAAETAAQSSPRETRSLNGEWEYVKTDSLDAPVPEDGWQSQDVPGVVYGYNYTRAWFRRTFEVPAEWQGKRVVVRFGGVKYNSRVLVNGERVGGCFNGYDPFECDITEAVRFGEENTLLVGAHDWTGIFSEGERIDFKRAEGRRDRRAVPRDRILSPIGGRWFHYGIWDDVELVAMPRTYLHEVQVSSSVRGKCIIISGLVLPLGSASQVKEVTARIHEYDGAPRDATGLWPANGAVVWEGRAAVASPGDNFSVTVKNPPLKLWWPHDPRLYVVEVAIPEGDRWTERIGYRELWAEGPDFYLNGAKTHLLATSWWPPHPPRSRDEIRETMASVKRMNATCFRTHTQPWRQRWYEVADEVGLLMIPEGAIWNDDSVYRVEDPVFWGHYRTHLESMVRHLFNHPSIVMWSLENEMHGGRMHDGTPQEDYVADMGLSVEALDPTRLITYESDGDPGGVADVIGLHYPNEYPQRRLWPNDAYWIDQKATPWRTNMFWDETEFTWNREKPLYIGEFLWAPAADPSNDTLFFGDEAYTDFREYHNRAKALSWRIQILAYRHAGVSGISPWTVNEHGPLNEENHLWRAQRDLYRPLAAFVREHDSRFYAGDTVERTVYLFNDTMADAGAVVFRWALLKGDDVLAKDQQILSMPSGSRAERTISMPMPEVSHRTALTLRLTLHEGEQERFREDVTVEVFPRAPLRVPSAAYLYDPQGGLSESLGENAMAFTPLDALDAWKGDGLLVIGPGALQVLAKASDVPVIGAPRGAQGVLTDTVARGGRVLLIEQEPGAGDWVSAQMSEQESTMAFIQRPHHPAFRGMSPGDLKWWRGDHLVSVNEASRPASGSGKALAVTGTGRGISHTPLLEIPHGNGVWMLCQLRVASKLPSEPVAALLLQNLLDYLANYEGGRGKTLHYGPKTLAATLEDLAVDSRELTDPDPLRYPDVELLILEAGNATVAEYAPSLHAFLESGGKVLWNKPAPEGFEEARSAVDLPVTMQPSTGPALRVATGSELVHAIAREDLYWLGPVQSVSWQRRPLVEVMTSGVFTPLMPENGVRELPIDDTLNVEGKYVYLRDGGISFATVGSATWPVTLETEGAYLLGVVAGGTPCDGAYPLVEARLDGERLGFMSVAQRDPRAYTLLFQAVAGEHELSIAFVNDKTSGNEDRNLFVERVMLIPYTNGGAFEALTSPPALVQIPVGKGHLVLNTIRWDDAGANAMKARRFISSLLAELGASFHSKGAASVIQAESLTPHTRIAHFSREDDHVRMGSNGFIEGPVHIATPGRYRIGLWARGSSAKGTYPIVVVTLDGKELGRVECIGAEWGEHAIVADLAEGDAVLRLAFINDYYEPPEDRNLWLDRVEFQLVDKP